MALRAQARVRPVYDENAPVNVLSGKGNTGLVSRKGGASKGLGLGKGADRENHAGGTSVKKAGGRTVLGDVSNNTAPVRGFGKDLTNGGKPAQSKKTTKKPTSKRALAPSISVQVKPAVVNEPPTDPLLEIEYAPPPPSEEEPYRCAELEECLRELMKTPILISMPIRSTFLDRPPPLFLTEDDDDDGVLKRLTEPRDWAAFAGTDEDTTPTAEELPLEPITDYFDDISISFL